MKRLKDKRGLTLLEVIIAIAILGIIATAFLNLFGSSFVSIARSGHKSEAVMSASDVIERVYSEYSEGVDKKELERFLNDELSVENPAESFDPDIEELENGYNLTVKYYASGDKKTELSSLTSFIPKPSSRGEQ